MNQFHYQQEGEQFLCSHKRAVLADEMGLGKTVQVVRAVERIFWDKEIKVLVICPAAVKSGWVKEISKFFIRKAEVVSCSESLGFRIAQDGFTILSFDLATSKQILPKLKETTWDVIVIDEIHFLRNKNAKRTQAILGRWCRGDETSLIAKAEYVWGLTGTPIPNHPGELFPVMRSFGVWKYTYWDLINRFCITKETSYAPQIVGVKNTKEFKELLAQFMLRRKKKDHMEHRAEPIYEMMEINPEGCIHPDDLKDWLVAENGADGVFLRRHLEKYRGKEDDPGFFGGLKKLHIQKLRRLMGLAKMKALTAKLIEELDSGELKKVVIFGIHRDVVELVRCELLEHGALIIYGGTKGKNKDIRVHQFKTDPDIKVMVMNIMAGGTGIDGLQEVCNEMVFIENSWVPTDNAQCVGRLDRIGQKKQVRVRFAYLKNSLDEKVQQVIKVKTEIASQIFS